MQYRRADVTGGTYFFTVNLAERKRTFLVDYIDDLRNMMKKVKTSHPFHIAAMVILHSAFHRYMRQGVYGQNWAGDDAVTIDEEFGV